MLQSPAFTNMKTTFLAAMIIFYSGAFTSCEKDPVTCHGCPIDTTTKEYEFLVSGTIASDCEGEAAADRSLELLVLYKQDTFTITGMTNASGDFQLTYTLLLPANFGMTAQWESYCLLRVKEDSVTFGLAGLETIQNLNLNVGDSLDLDIYLDFDQHPLLETDTLYFRFEPFILSHMPYAFKADGPSSHHAFIRNVKDKWRFIEIDDAGNPYSQIYWKIEGDGSSQSSSSWHTLLPKRTCVFTHDSAVIDLHWKTTIQRLQNLPFYCKGEAGG